MEAKVRDAFMVLLRSGLWDHPVLDLSVFPLTDAEWKTIYLTAIAQTVEGLVLEGIQSLPDALQPPKRILLKWVVRMDSIERHNKTIESTTGHLIQFFKKNNVTVDVLKGTGMALHYPKPEVRTCGDIDFYFSDEASFNKARQLVQEKGIVIEQGVFKSLYYFVGTVCVEHHLRLIDIANPWCKKYLKTLEEQEFNQKIYHQTAGFTFSTPSVLLTHVQINTHILKHYLGFGIGLRQFCDVARFCYAKSKVTDAKQLKEVYQQLGIGKWMEEVYTFLVQELGMDRMYLPYELGVNKNVSWLLDDVISSGNFGFFDAVFQKSNDKLTENKTRASAWRRVMPHLFQGYKLAFWEAIWFPIQYARTKLS